MRNAQMALIAALTMLGAAAAAQEAGEIWSLEGLDAPESALHDPERDVIYVSNVGGQPLDKDGNGAISRVSPEGEMIEADWVSGLDGPKGLALHEGTLHVTDIDRLVAIDVASGEITGEWPAEGAEFLNDAAADDEGRIYASDMIGNRIYRLADGAMSVWLEDEALEHPNGLKVMEGILHIASWGAGLREDATTEEPGRLLTVDLETKEIVPFGSGEGIGNLDGLEPDGAGNWLVTDWVAGGLYRIDPEGEATRLHPLAPGSADLGFMAGDGVALIPMSSEGRLVAYRLASP